MLVSFIKSRFYDLPACKLEDWNVTISHRPHSSLMGKGVHRGVEVKPSSLLMRRYIIQNIVLLRKTNKLLLYSHINTKYLIIVNNFFVIQCNLSVIQKIWNVVLRVRVTFSGVGGGLIAPPPPIGLSAKMQNKKINTFLALLRLVFALQWIKSDLNHLLKHKFRGGG